MISSREDQGGTEWDKMTNGVSVDRKRDEVRMETRLRELTQV